MNDFYTKVSQNCDSPLRESYEVYLHSKRAAVDLISSLTPADLRGALLMLQADAPHATAKMLAIMWPWSDAVACEVEDFIQEFLPLD